MDAPWPRSRTCAATFHLYEYCHVVAAYMLDIARHALPTIDWYIFNAERHSVVALGEPDIILDLNLPHDPREVLEKF